MDSNLIVAGVPIRAWHCLGVTSRLRYGDNRLVMANHTLEVDADPHIGRSGLHASTDIVTALNLGWGGPLCRVEVSGSVDFACPLMAGTKRKCLWMMNQQDVLKATIPVYVDLARSTVSYWAETKNDVLHAYKVLDDFMSADKPVADYYGIIPFKKARNQYSSFAAYKFFQVFERTVEILRTLKIPHASCCWPVEYFEYAEGFSELVKREDYSDEEEYNQDRDIVYWAKRRLLSELIESAILSYRDQKRSSDSYY